MKNLFRAAVLIAAVPLRSLAAEAPVATPTGLPSTGLTMKDCLVVLQGLNGLDQHQVVLNQGKPNEQAVMLPYRFGNGSLRGDIGHDIAMLTTVQQGMQAAQQKIFAEVAKGATEIKPGTPEAGDYDKQLTELTNKPCQADIVKINLKDLKLEENEIPGSIIAALDKILVR